MFGATQVIEQAEAVKILMAGDFDKDHRPLFEDIASAVSSNPDYDNTVYVMSTELPAKKIEKVNDRLYKYGVGTERVFEWTCKSTENENYRRLDLETAELYFSDKALLEDIKNQGFELGIGGLNMADSLLFRHMGVQYIKISDEDVESYTMHSKLKIPVLTSAYPSSLIWPRFDYSTLPNFGNLSYRLPFFGLYQVEKYEYMNHQAAMKKIIGGENHKLVDDFDQDHAMILGHGTRAGLYQAIMMKPPNVKYVYPMTPERKEVKLPSSLKKAIVVFNVEADRYDDAMGCPHNREALMKEITATADKGLGVVVMGPPSMAEELKKAAGDKVTFVETANSSQIKLVRGAGTEDLKMYWVGSCTQNNFISGIGEHNAMMVGYAKNADKTD